ncbi:hypothetical protein [Polaribacter atrinae]|uniref:hypothetical protein n=1 Tax=Polaribacter atrinae TaxID=1333662 RepID=UPI0030FD04AE
MKNKLTYFKKVLGKRNFKLLIITSCLIALIISIVNAYIDNANGYNIYNLFILINFLMALIIIWFIIIICFEAYNRNKQLIIELVSAKNNKIRLSKSLAFASIFAIIIGYSTSELTYRLVQDGKSYIIGIKQHKDLIKDANKDPWSKKRDFKSTIIIMSFVLGASLSYTLIKEK